MLCVSLRPAICRYSRRLYLVTLPAVTNVKRSLATDEQIKKLMEIASPQMKKAIILGSCSLRREEACALAYSDIEEGGVHVHATLTQNRDNEWVYEDRAKTPGSARHVTMPPDMIKALGKGDGFIIKLASPDVVSRLFKRYAARIGADISFHSLRRYYASICHALGIPDKYIMKQGGWKSADVMRRSYQHTLDDQERVCQDKFDDHLWGIL